MKQTESKYPGDDYKLIEWKSDGTFNFLRPDGSLVSEEWLDDADNFSEGLAAVSNKGNGYYLWHDGSYMKIDGCREANPFSCGFGLVVLDDDTGHSYNFVDKVGNLLLPKGVKHATGFHDGIATIIDDDGPNYLTTTGKLLLSKRYDILHPFCEGFGIIERFVPKDSKYLPGKVSEFAFVDKNGKILRDRWFIGAHNFNEGLAVVRRSLDEKYNYLKPDGDFLLEKWTAHASDFHEGFGIIGVKMGACDFVDKNGNRLLNKWVFHLNQFENGQAIVYPENKNMYLSLIHI